jgi:hypothetical protein
MERIGSCRFCDGAGEKLMIVPGTRTKELIELTEDEKSELKKVLVTEWREAKLMSVKVVTRPCGMCLESGFGADAMKDLRN